MIIWPSRRCRGPEATDLATSAACWQILNTNSISMASPIMDVASNLLANGSPLLLGKAIGEQGPSRYRYLPTIDAGGGGLWDPQGMLISTGAERLLGPVQAPGLDAA